jgi:hypothetical protein
MMTVGQMMALEAKEFSEAMRKVSPELADWVDQRLAEGFTVQAVKDALKVLNEAAKAARQEPTS